MKIKTLQNVPLEKVFSSFMRSFEDYEVQFGKSELIEMMRRRGFNSEMSFGIFEGDEILAFILNGIGHYMGEKMAYDMGTGTLKQHRGSGLASQVFDRSLQSFRTHHIKKYLLEVLHNNDKALHLYKKIGFEITREFYYFRWYEKEWEYKVTKPKANYEIDYPQTKDQEKLQQFWDFAPSWQNSFESISRAENSFRFIAVSDEADIRGYSMFDPLTGDIAQIAVDREFRGQGIGSLLLQEMHRINKSASMKIINTESSCDSILKFLRSRNIHPAGRQYEMMLEF